MGFTLKNYIIAALLAAILLISSGCGEDISDYSSLAKGDIPRPELEYILDLNYWFETFEINPYENYLFRNVLDSMGILEVERTNLIAFQRDDYITVECTYSLPEGEDSVVSGFLDIDPPGSQILNHIDFTKTMACIYTSGDRQAIKAYSNVITDPMMVELMFEGSRKKAMEARSFILSQHGIFEGAILRHFTDERLFVLFADTDSEGGIDSHQVDLAIITRSATGEPVTTEIAQFISLMGGLFFKPFMEDFGLEEMPKFEKTEVRGYKGYTLGANIGEPAVMVDADGYFFFGVSEQGVEKAIDAFSFSELENNAPSEANLYLHLNFDELLVRVPSMTSLQDVLTSLGSDALAESLQGAFSGWTDQLARIVEDVDEDLWQDLWIVTTGDGLVIGIRFQSALASLNIMDDTHIQGNRGDDPQDSIGQSDEIPPEASF